MEGKIRILDPSIAAKVAAGEVVAGPASVVKELMENSIDAGASAIVVAANDGGRRFIRVADDGCGMGQDDAELLFRRHATSKISADEDLFRIRTMGFRGEALYSISSVSKTTLRTKKAGELKGIEIRAVDNMADTAPVGCAEGTVVEVRGLFYNTPGRLKFLKSPDAEFGKILEVFKKIALIHPGIRFKLIKDSDVVMDTASGSLKERILELFGADFAGKLLEIDHLFVSGFATEPSLTYSNSRHIFIYVNRRSVQDKGILRAVMDGYGRLVEARRYPFTLIDLRMPPSDIDVNIHPQKAEVRFKQGSNAYDSVKSGVRKALSAVPSAYSWRETAYGAQSPAPHAMAGESAALYGTMNLPEKPLLLDATAGAGDVKSPWLLNLAVVGQLWGEFLVAEEMFSKDYFYIIDQHAASERCAFERLKKEYSSNGVKKQLLLVPEQFDASHEEAAAVLSSLDGLDSAGFEIAPFGGSNGGGSFLIRAVPAMLSGRALSGLVKDIAEDLALNSWTGRIEDAVEACLMRIACHSVIRGARPLTSEEGRRLLLDLSLVDFASRCPHGRPVIKKLARAELDAYFKRR